MQSCRQTSPNTQCNYCTVELKFWTIMTLSLLLQSFYINKVFSSLFTNTQSSFRKLAGVIENQREFIHVLHSIYWHHWQSQQMTYGGQQRAFVGSSLTQIYHQKKKLLSFGCLCTPVPLTPVVWRAPGLWRQQSSGGTCRIIRGRLAPNISSSATL